MAYSRTNDGTAPEKHARITSRTASAGQIQSYHMPEDGSYYEFDFVLMGR